MFPKGNVSAALPLGNAAKRLQRNRLCGELLRGLQNLEAPLHAKRAAPTGANFLLVRKFPKGNEFILFASAKRTKKQPGLRPATPVQIAGRDSVFTEMTGVHQVTGFVQTAILHSIDGNDLNRCELQA